jgi:hypothetical protein
MAPVTGFAPSPCFVSNRPVSHRNKRSTSKFQEAVPVTLTLERSHGRRAGVLKAVWQEDFLDVSAILPTLRETRPTFRCSGLPVRARTAATLLFVYSYGSTVLTEVLYGFP